jgi:hypothetical protein
VVWQKTGFLKTSTIIVGLALSLAGCAAQSTAPESGAQDLNTTVSASSGEPRTITDLSQISRAKAVPTPLQGVGSNFAPPGARASNSIVQQNVERWFVANVDQLRYHEGPADAPGETGLLNDKAREFSQFSYQLLNQTLREARRLEPERLAGRKLPLDLAPMVLTAIMDSRGRLTEIVINSHSGDHQVDQIIIDACKRGLWSRNLPVQAADSDGMYRVKIRGYIRPYVIDLKGRYRYETQFGLAIL